MKIMWIDMSQMLMKYFMHVYQTRINTKTCMSWSGYINSAVILKASAKRSVISILGNPFQSKPWLGSLFLQTHQKLPALD